MLTDKEEDVDDLSSDVVDGVLLVVPKVVEDGLLSVVVVDVDIVAAPTNAASDGKQSPPADTEFSIWDEVDVLVFTVAVVSFFSFF